MTKKTPKPTPAHMQKLADLMDTRPEGVTTRQVQNAPSVSPTLAKAALIEIGAVEQDGKWVFEPEPVTIDPSKRQIVAPDDATHQNLETGCFYKAVDGAAYYFSFDDESWWACGATAHDLDVAAHVIRLPVDDQEIECETSLNAGLMPSTQGFGHLSVYGDSKLLEIEGIKTEDEPTDILPQVSVFDAQKALDRHMPQMRNLVDVSEQVTKSDFAVALEAERQRVFDAVANGGTAECLAELTGLHVDDVQMHLDVLIDDGAVVERPVIVAMSYGVAT